MKEKFPNWFSLKIPAFIRVSRDLSKKSGHAMYGMVTRLRPASDKQRICRRSAWSMLIEEIFGCERREGKRK